MEPIVYTTEQVAELLQISVSTLKRWRGDGIGPSYIKPGNAAVVLYTRADIDNWLDQGRVPTKNQGLHSALAPAMEQYSRGLDADTVREHERASALLQTSIQMIWEVLRKVDKDLPPIWEVANIDTSEATSAYDNYPDGMTI